MDHLASFDHAWRYAVRLAERLDIDYVILFTGDPKQPYQAQPEEGQPNAVALITVDPRVALRFDPRRLLRAPTSSSEPST